MILCCRWIVFCPCPAYPWPKRRCGCSLFRSATEQKGRMTIKFACGPPAFTIDRSGYSISDTIFRFKCKLSWYLLVRRDLFWSGGQQRWRISDQTLLLGCLSWFDGSLGWRLLSWLVQILRLRLRWRCISRCPSTSADCNAWRMGPIVFVGVWLTQLNPSRWFCRISRVIRCC